MPPETENFKPVEESLFLCNGFLFRVPEGDLSGMRGFYSRDFPQAGRGPLGPSWDRIPADLQKHGVPPHLIRFEASGAASLTPLEPAVLPNLLTPAWCRGFALDFFRFSPAPGFFLLLRIEISAYRFRERIERGARAPTDRILNELFILHYFRLYCLLQKRRADPEGLEDFLGRSSGMATVRKHLAARKTLF